MEELKNKLPFPIKQELSKEFLKDNFWKCLYTSASDELNYWVILPNNVKPVRLEPTPINDIGLTGIGQYVRIDESPYLEVQVVYEHSLYEMNTSDWIEKKLYITQETIINYRLINGKTTGNYLDVLTYKKLPNGEEVISRLTVLKDFDKKKGGANYFCIKASCPISEYEKLSNNIFQVVSNWDLINKTDWQMAENLKPFAIYFSEKVEFYVPFSWDIAYDKDNTNLNSRFIFTHLIGDENKGIINAFFYEINSIKGYDDVFKKSIKRLVDLNGFEHELSDLTKSETNNPFIDELYTSSGLFSYKKENFTSYAQLSIIKTKYGWYYFESVGPKPNLENYYWEINKRCMELIRDSYNNLEFQKREKIEDEQKSEKRFHKGYVILEDEIRKKRGFWGGLFG
jgi:hypothetical protein